MDAVIDASAVLAVLLNEPERAQMLKLTEGANTVAPASLPYEIANAISSLVRRRRVSSIQATELWRQWRSMAVQLRDIDVGAAVDLAASRGLYAYDAFVLRCSIEARLPLLTLDQRMQAEAAEIGIKLLR